MDPRQRAVFFHPGIGRFCGGGVPKEKRHPSCSSLDPTKIVTLEVTVSVASGVSRNDCILIFFYE